MKVGDTVKYLSYRFVAKGTPRISTLSTGVIAHENSTQYKIEGTDVREVVWRLKVNVMEVSV